MTGARIRRWWRRAGDAQAGAALFVAYYVVLPFFAWLARRDPGGLHARGWIRHDGAPGASADALRRQY